MVNRWMLIVGLFVCGAWLSGADGDWEHHVTLFGFFSGQEGTVGARGLNLPAEVDFATIAENLESGALMHYEAGSGPWRIIGEVIFIAVGATAEGALGDTTVDIDQTVLELDVAYRVAPSLEILLGARYIDLDTTLEKRFLGTILDTGKDWLDPLVGLRFRKNLADKWSFALLGDIGGFGLGSELTWNASTFAGYRFSEIFSVQLGYRYMDVDYEDGDRLRERFVYDMVTDGPQLGFTFHW